MPTLVNLKMAPDMEDKEQKSCTQSRKQASNYSRIPIKQTRVILGFIGLIRWCIVPFKTSSSSSGHSFAGTMFMESWKTL